MFAILGFEAWDFTLRELDAAVKAKRMEQWDHTAYTIAMLGSAMTGSRLELETFHPLREITKTLDDPAKEYERLMRRHHATNNHPRPVSDLLSERAKGWRKGEE